MPQRSKHGPFAEAAQNEHANKYGRIAGLLLFLEAILSYTERPPFESPVDANGSRRAR